MVNSVNSDSGLPLEAPLSPRVLEEKGELNGVEVTVEAGDEESWFQKALQVVWKVVKISLQVIVGLGLFVSNSSFFTVGFVAGLIFSDKVKLMVEQIKKLWYIPWVAIPVIAVGGFLSLPITLAASALLYGAYIGAKISDYADEKMRESLAADEEERAPSLGDDDLAVV